MRRLLFKSLVHGPLAESSSLSERRRDGRTAAQVDRVARRRLGRTLSIRGVDAGSCNGLGRTGDPRPNNVLYDLEQFGMRSWPRRATPMSCSSPVPLQPTCVKPSSAPIKRLRTRSGWWRWGLCAGRRRFLGQLCLCRRRISRLAGRLAYPRLPTLRRSRCSKVCWRCSKTSSTVRPHGRKIYKRIATTTSINRIEMPTAKPATIGS